MSWESNSPKSPILWDVNWQHGRQADTGLYSMASSGKNCMLEKVSQLGEVSTMTRGVATVVYRYIYPPKKKIILPYKL